MGRDLLVHAQFPKCPHLLLQHHLIDVHAFAWSLLCTSSLGCLLNELLGLRRVRDLLDQLTPAVRLLVMHGLTPPIPPYRTPRWLAILTAYPFTLLNNPSPPAHLG